MQAHATDRQAWLIGIDDTDNLDTRGTGHRARMLLAALEEAALVMPLGITRHQLLVDPRIPYTSHNSSACLQVVPCGAVAEVFEFCRAHLLETAAAGSDVGLTMARLEQGTALVEFGLRAKTEVLEQDEARSLAAAHEIACVGLTGTQGGVIGALAAVGLFAWGNDGRYLWKRGLRDLAEQVVRVADIAAITGIDDIRVAAGDSVLAQGEAGVALGPWPRPVRVDGRSVLLVKEGTSHAHATYECLDKQLVKAFRP